MDKPNQFFPGIAVSFLALFLTFGLQPFVPRDEGPVFDFRTLDGGQLQGSIKKWAADGSVGIGGERPGGIAGRDLAGVRRHNLTLPVFPRDHAVILNNNDRLPLDPKIPLKLEKGRLYLHLPAPLLSGKGREVGVPRAFISVLWLEPARGLEFPEKVIRGLLAGKRSHDLLILRNGDRLEGNLTGILLGKGFQVEVGNRQVEVEITQVSCIAFNTELRARFIPPAAYTHLVLAGGGRLGLSRLVLDSESRIFQARSLFGFNLEVPIAQVAALDMRNDRIVYLSDLKPKGYEFTPFLGVTWPLAADTSVGGSPLCVAGSTFDKGLGMHSQSRVTYLLEGKYRWFEALVGLNDREGRRGRVRIKILVDGKEQKLGLEGDLSANQAPFPVRIDLHKGRELALEVLFGSSGDVQAHVDWAGARLIR